MNPAARSTFQQSRRLTALGLLLSLALSGCQSPKLIETRKPQAKDDTISHLLNPKRLTRETRHQLHLAGFGGRRSKNGSLEEIRKLETILGMAPTIAQRTALSELLSDAAGLRKKSEPDAAFELYLASARTALPAAEKASIKAEDDDLLALYNHACGQIAELLYLSRTKSGKAGEFSWNVVEADRGQLDPLGFNELKVAEYLKIKGYDRREVELGVGGALVGHWDYEESYEKSRPFFPRVGMALPITAVVDFPNSDTAEITFYDTMIATTGRVDGSRVPLASDLTAPLALLMELRPSKNIGIKSMLRPADYLKLCGLYKLEPFRPEKIPVVLVHGLSKSPAAWIPAVNELRADREIRENYQFLLFQYPSGLPATYCGAQLRHHLHLFREHHDPSGQLPAMSRMVLAGKSFGGVTSSQQIRESGEEIRKLFSTRPLDETGIPQEEVAALSQLMHFQPNPDIQRTIFLGTPHRGTDVADTRLARMASRVINYPLTVLLDGNELPESDAMTPLARQYLQDPPNSVVDLRPPTPVLETIAGLPIGRHITVHSIVGKHTEGPLEESNDKMVPYWSSHLEEAVSELVVPCIHGELESHPNCVAELRRILLLHLEEAR